MWHAFEVVIDLIDLVVHWRLYACFLSGLALAFFAYRSTPDPNLAIIIAIALGAAGLLVGLISDWRT